MSLIRDAGKLSMLLISLWLFNVSAFADEFLSAISDREKPSSTSDATITDSRPHFDFSQITKQLLTSRIELPRSLRVSRSHQPLRQISLVGGDHFVAECLNWGIETSEFRLLSGQVVRLPTRAIERLANPRGEICVLDESFEAGSSTESMTSKSLNFDTNQAADGQRSLRIDASSSEYVQSFLPPFDTARIEFSFRINSKDDPSASGEWQIEWAKSENQFSPVIVRIEANRTVKLVTEIPGGQSSFQSLQLSDEWHSFIAVVSRDRTRFIVDESNLASFPTPNVPIQAIRFRPCKGEAGNGMWIDELRVSRLNSSNIQTDSKSDPIDNDLLELATGDELFGRLTGVSRLSTAMDTFGGRQVIAWNQISGLRLRQSEWPINQIAPLKLGVVSKIQLQPFIDRPDCEPESLTATVCHVDSRELVIQHSLLGKLTLHWSDVRNLEPQFFGRSKLLDARRFHLGNSIRPELHRHLPDTTELRVGFEISEVPEGKTFLSLDVAELEAASHDAPPASPFLAELGAGRLVTEVLINEKKIGDLNSLVRFKVASQNPERVRMAIPRSHLKVGENTIRLRQQALKAGGSEFDDCEVGSIRLEFEFE